MKVTRAPGRMRGVGVLERAACELAAREILVERDHDDVLSCGCLAQLVDAFRSTPGRGAAPSYTS